MTSEEWQRVRSILESALELDSANRPAFLDRACADASLRSEVESLIAIHEQAGTNVLEPGSAVKLELEQEAQFRLVPGKRIGAYEIAEEIGVGGMGAVYRAIRADGKATAKRFAWPRVLDGYEAAWETAFALTA